jgi:phosphatidylinositol alpha-mannosyltransferase
LRVAVVCPYALDRPGGVQNATVELTAGYSRAGHESWLVAPGEGIEYQPAAAGSLDIRLVGKATTVPINQSQAPFALSPRSVRRTRQALTGADVVHLHEPFAPLTSVAALFRSPTPIVGTFHASPTPRLGRVYDAASPLLRRVARRLTRTTAVSERAAHAVRKIVPDARIIPNGVDTADYRREADRVPHRVLFIGRDDHRKGLSVLLEAWPKVLAEVEAELWVLGADGSAPGVRYLGQVDEEAKRAALSEAAILCSPNLAGESFGIVTLEGMAAGCAVIASDLPAFRQLVGDAGVLVPIGDAGALAAALVTLVREPGWARRLGEMAQQAAARYDWTAVAGQYTEELAAATT